MANLPQDAGREAQEKWGWFYSHRFLLLRRLSQLVVLALFLAGPAFGVWILRGNYSSSKLFGAIPFTDPLLMLQSLLTGYWPHLTALLGAVIVLVLYGVLAGRLYCSWVCPFNPISDLAAWMRRKLGIRTNVNLSNRLRYFILIAVLVGSAVSGVVVWEWLNPISAVGRGLIYTAGQSVTLESIGRVLFFGFGAGIWLILAIFLFDLFVLKNGWCGHLCPVGALYGAVGRKGLVHIAADKRAACSKCMDCIHVCPEPHVLTTPLFGKQDNHLILNQECTRCGRCIDVCSEKVFSIKARFHQSGGKE